VIETNAQYHADGTHLSRSELARFIDSPKAYNAIHVAKTEPKPEPSIPMTNGSLLHCFVLEPDTFTDRFCVSNLSSRRGKGWVEFADHAKKMERIPVLESQVELTEAMAEAINEDEETTKLLKLKGVAEQPIRWTHEATGLKLKCKPDWRTLNTPICLDVKSAVGPQYWGFWRACRDRGYWRQAYHYLVGCKAETGVDHTFAFSVVGNKWPHDVYLYQCDLDFPKVVEAGNEAEDALERLKISLETNVWRAPGQNKWNPIGD